MTAKELRDFLAGFEDETPVLVSGYESGYDEPKKVVLVQVEDRGEETKKEEWWAGRYETPWDKTKTTFYALVIPR